MSPPNSGKVLSSSLVACVWQLTRVSFLRQTFGPKLRKAIASARVANPSVFNETGSLLDDAAKETRPWHEAPSRVERSQALPRCLYFDENFEGSQKGYQKERDTKRIPKFSSSSGKPKG